MERKIINLNIGRPNLHRWNGVTVNSGIRKKLVEEVMLTKDGFIGDGVANREFHGGPDRAVCLYPYEHYEFWEKEFNKPLSTTAFGENICVQNMLEKDVYIGDTFSLGEAIVQVTQGRIPCATIIKHNDADQLLKRVVETGFTGYFFRVLKEGVVDTKSNMELIERKQEKFSILNSNHLMFHDRTNRNAIEELIQIDELAEVWKNKFMKALNIK